MIGHRQKVTLDEHFGRIPVARKQRIGGASDALPDQREESEDLPVDLLKFTVELHAKLIGHVKNIAGRGSD